MIDLKQPTNDSGRLIAVLMDGVIKCAPALPFKRKGFYADMALITEKGGVKIRAESYDLESGEEIFYLDLDKFLETSYWIDSNGNSSWPLQGHDESQWKAVDLSEEIRKAGLASILESHRQVKLYREPTHRLGELRGVLKSAKVLTMSSVCGGQRIAVSATSIFPCSIEVAFDSQRADELLDGLEKITLEEDQSWLPTALKQSGELPGVRLPGNRSK